MTRRVLAGPLDTRSTSTPLFHSRPTSSFTAPATWLRFEPPLVLDITIKAMGTVSGGGYSQRRAVRRSAKSRARSIAAKLLLLRLLRACIEKSLGSQLIHQLAGCNE